MKRRTILLALGILLTMSVPAAGGDMVFTLRDAAGTVVGPVYPLEQGQSVTLTLTVSAIPAPGIMTMGYTLTYDPAILAIDTTDPGGNGVDADSWPVRGTDDLAPGVITSHGARMSLTSEPSIMMAPIFGDNIPIGTMTFAKTAAHGRSLITIEKRRQSGEEGTPLTADDFALFTDPPILLTGLDATPQVIGALTDPGDLEGDGDVDGADLARLLTETCVSGPCDPAADVFARYYGW